MVKELQAGPGKPGSGVPDLLGIAVRTPSERDVDEVLHALRAHTGEREPLALVADGTVVPVIDEGPARGRSCRHTIGNDEPRVRAHGLSAILRVHLQHLAGTELGCVRAGKMSSCATVQSSIAHRRKSPIL